MPTTDCRRCSDCTGAEHHWMDNSDAHRETDPSYACKHCDAVGDECETCDGEGGRTSDDGHPLALCPPCKGYGVAARAVGSARCACPRTDGKDCLRFRSMDDMRELLGDEPINGDDDGCECSCHDVDDDFDSEEDRL